MNLPWIIWHCQEQKLWRQPPSTMLWIDEQGDRGGRLDSDWTGLFLERGAHCSRKASAFVAVQGFWRCNVSSLSSLNSPDPKLTSAPPAAKENRGDWSGLFWHGDLSNRPPGRPNIPNQHGHEPPHSHPKPCGAVHKTIHNTGKTCNVASVTTWHVYSSCNGTLSPGVLIERPHCS